MSEEKDTKKVTRKTEVNDDGSESSSVEVESKKEES